AISGASGYVSLGGLVLLHPHDHSPVEGRVRLSMTAAVESMSRGGARGRRKWCDPAKLRPRGLGPDPSGVVTGDDENLGSGVWSDAECLDELGSRLSRQLLEQCLVRLGLDVEVTPAAGERAQCMLGG